MSNVATQFIYGGLTMKAGNGYQSLNVDGLNGLQVRTSETNNTGNPGSTIWEQQYGPRTIVLSGQVRGVDESQYFERKANLVKAFLKGSSELDITMWDGSRKVIQAYPIQQPSIIEQAGRVNFNDFQVIMKCPDPFFKSLSTKELVIDDFLGGGGVIPVAEEMVLVGTNNSGNINNEGDLEAYPEIRIDGSFTTIEIINSTTGESISIDQPIPDGNFVRIYRENSSEFVLLNNSTNFKQFVPNELFTLVEGNNNIVVNGTGTNSNSKVTVSFNDHYFTIYS